ncbi:hypothetical protein [Nocardioides zeicaulis]|uniref:Uncharacterized protein n=1 Tax=Nocardioides zeicaulis TaxID=1776857 RepID=A0ABV6E1G0_9ACTN
MLSRGVSMIVVRESNESDEVQFDGMREQTYQPLRDKPEVEVIRQMGMVPMTCGRSFTIQVPNKQGETVEVEIPVRTIEHQSASVRVFSYAGWVHVWSMSSAAKETDTGLNAFTKILIDLIREYKPDKIYAANVSRLVRSQRQAALLLAELLNKVETVWAGGVPFTFKGAGAQHGMMLFSVLAMIASTERDWIIQRLLCGKIAHWRNGKWPWGNSTVPFGYAFDPDNVKLVCIEEMREQVREMLLILSQQNVPDSELVRQLGAIGVTSSRSLKTGAERRNIASLADPTTAINTLYAWAPLWIAGEYLLRHANGYDGLEELSGVPVVRSGNDEVERQLDELGLLDTIYDAMEGDSDGAVPMDLDETTNHLIEDVFHKVESDRGELQLLYKLPVPKNGWAERDVLDAFATAARKRHASLKSRRTHMRPLSLQVTGESDVPDLHASLLSPSVARGNDTRRAASRDAARAHRLVPPFAGRSWNDGEWDFELFVTKSQVYELRAWPVGQNPTGVAQDEVNTGSGSPDQDEYDESFSFLGQEEYA